MIKRFQGARIKTGGRRNPGPTKASGSEPLPKLINVQVDGRLDGHRAKLGYQNAPVKAETDEHVKPRTAIDIPKAREGEPTNATRAVDTLKAAEANRLRARLFLYMEKHNLTRKGWARDAGLSSGVLRNFLSGKSQDLTRRSLVGLARAVDLDVSAFFADLVDPAGTKGLGHLATSEQLQAAIGDLSEKVDAVREEIASAVRESTDVMREMLRELKALRTGEPPDQSDGHQAGGNRRRRQRGGGSGGAPLE